MSAGCTGHFIVGFVKQHSYYGVLVLAYFFSNFMNIYMYRITFLLCFQDAVLSLLTSKDAIVKQCAARLFNAFASLSGGK